MSVGKNGFRVKITDTPEGWRVAIEDPQGVALLERACADGSEARTFASTVRQHIYWLSPSKFREYYRV